MPSTKYQNSGAVNQKSGRAQAHQLWQLGAMPKRPDIDHQRRVAIGARLKSAREAAGLSQQQLGAEAGLRQQTIVELESGRSRKSTRIVQLAKALGCSPEWLDTGEGDLTARPEGIDLIGYVGAGAEILPVDDLPARGTYGTVPIPDFSQEFACVEVRGTSMHPLQAGWRLLYRLNIRGVPVEALNKLCVVQVNRGPTFVKVLRRGTKPKTYTLESWNEPTREDIEVEWAAPIAAILTR